MKVGDKIVCIKPFENPTKYPIILPIVDKIYTIRMIGDDDGMYFLLNEIYNEIYVKEEPGFYSDWFRKVDESFSEGILENIKEQIEEEQLQLI